MHATAVRRLTGDDHLNHEFATTWKEYDLDEPTKALLTFAEKLTKEPSAIIDQDIQKLKENGFDDDSIYEVTALISFYNFTGRLEAAAGLPFDYIPEKAEYAEAIK